MIEPEEGRKGNESVPEIRDFGISMFADDNVSGSQVFVDYFLH